MIGTSKEVYRTRKLGKTRYEEKENILKQSDKEIYRYESILHEEYKFKTRMKCMEMDRDKNKMYPRIERTKGKPPHHDDLSSLALKG